MYISNKNKRSKLFFILIGLVFILVGLDFIIGNSSGLLKYYTVSFSLKKAVSYLALYFQPILLQIGYFIALLIVLVVAVTYIFVSIRLTYRLYRKNLYYSLNILSEGIEYKHSLFPSMPVRFSRSVFLSKESIDHVEIKKRTFTTQLIFFLVVSKHQKDFHVFLPFTTPEKRARLIGTLKQNRYRLKEDLYMNRINQSETTKRKSRNTEESIQSITKEELSKRSLIKHAQG